MSPLLRAPAPFVKWAGGKKALSAKVVDLISDQHIHRYYEPFLGGGAVFFALHPKRAVLSDSNPELINAYLQIRSHVAEVIELLKAHQASHSRAYYYSVRKDPPSDPVARAAWFLYLNRTCYNGLWRVNSSGRFNVPMGSYKNPRIVDEQKLRAASIALQPAEIVCADFESVLTHLSPRPNMGDVVYFDPPYVPLSSTAHFTAYTKEDFTEEDQRRLARVARVFNDKGVRLILSNSETPLIRSLFPNPPFKTNVVRMSRAISSVGSGRGKIPELLIHN
jgi:DNA adenine methylase